MIVEPQPALSLPEWLRQFALLVAGDLDMDDARERLREYGASLRADFAPSVFTPASARFVARTANAKGFFPRYPEVCRALTEWAKANPTGAPRLAGQVKPGSGRWQGFIASRLVAGGDRANLLSLAKQYAGEELPAILAAYYPDEAAAEAERVARRARAKQPTMRAAE